MKGENVPGLDNPRQTLRDIGLLVRDRDGGENIRKEDEYNVPRFLNRVLALEVDQQNALFDYFADLFDQTVRYAKANGTFDEGVTDIKALAVRVAVPPSVVHTDEITKAQTTHYTLEVDVPSRAVSFEEAEEARQRKTGAFLRHRKNGHFVLAVESGRHTDPATGNSIALSQSGNRKQHTRPTFTTTSLTRSTRRSHPNGRVAGGRRSMTRSHRLKPSKLTLSAGQSFRFGSA